MAMERLLFSVVSEGAEWRVTSAGDLCGRYRSKLRALEDASERAYQGHLYNGDPTGVEVRMNCGDAVLVRRYGE